MEEPTPTPYAPAPDLMNDPQYATNIGEEDGMGDVDTCRICRGEGLEQAEPLFHPCRCSGSIKYVHQDCLMEWLSHSQKKHCELCKTPFRFTKLYSPDMPQTLPLHLLIRHVVIHAVKNIATWLRGGLVAVVWLACLPFVIRQIWRILFWISDGGWPSQNTTSRNTTLSSVEVLENARKSQLGIGIPGNGTSPATPLEASPTTSAQLGGIIKTVFDFISPQAMKSNVSDALSSLETNRHQNATTHTGPYVSNETTNGISSLQRATLLSEVKFLKNLTRSPHVNRLIVTIAEGYVITILVVVCFILIFLIREWVVQQQPGINMGAGFNAEFAIPERPRDIQAAQRVRDRADGVEPDPQPPRDIAQRPIARPRRRIPQLEDAAEAAEENRLFVEQQDEVERAVAEANPDLSDARLQNRPSPVRDALSPAAEIQRSLTEEQRLTQEFISIYNRANGDRDEVLRIIEMEGKGDDMRHLANYPRIEELLTSEVITGSQRNNLVSARSPSHNSGSTQGQAGSETGSVSSESWIDIPESSSSRKQSSALDERSSTWPNDQEPDPPQIRDKGKGTVDSVTDVEPTLHHSEREHSSKTREHLMNVPVISRPSIFSSSSTSSRPRAVSDGPQPTSSISPFANNSWTFPAIADVSNTSDSGNSNVEIRQPAEITKYTTQAYAITSSSALADSQAWKAAQDLRVQQAVARGREAREIAVEPSFSMPQDLIEIRGQDDHVEIVQSEDRGFVHPTEPESDSEDDDQEQPNNEADLDRLVDDSADIAAHNVGLARPEPQGVLGHMAEFLWGGAVNEVHVADPVEDDEHIVHNLEAEPPFVPVDHPGVFEQDAAPQDREVVEAAIAAGLDPNDPDVIDDAEDFEGIMELVGMRGPIGHLFQNAIFSAFLLALTVAFGLWIPYNIGRVSILLVANPGSAFKLPLRLLFACATLIQDLAISIVGLALYCLLTILTLPLRLWDIVQTSSAASVLVSGAKIGSTALRLSREALDRIMDDTISSLVHIADSEMFAFSAASHESLFTLGALVASVFSSTANAISFVFSGNYIALPRVVIISLHAIKSSISTVLTFPAILAKPETWVISLEFAKRTTPLDLELSVWSGTDRFWAILTGYTALCVLGALYVRKGTPFSTSQVGRDWEAAIIDLLNQAGGVMKVILIISIEMLVFPLYCGLLLDVALLPLFESATIMSRVEFTLNSPLTSIFIHWFVGTCYMFHFALFVSMCRKIMRRGVLYFIRDPDDPTFHPVRDVLERNVATQLRKILFSALVYGALVVICLGGVVWGLSFACRGVLPIHWSSNEPVLEFPIDLLFYNFLMPLAVKFFKPSDGLHVMYSWWFRQCARMLRLTWFMFNERRIDEEGYNVRRTWIDVLRQVKGDPEKALEIGDINAPFVADPDLHVYFRHDGRYVRAPASDQVRIPKGTRIFLPVDSENNRIDGTWDSAVGVHGRSNPLFTHLYVPPWFRLRICVFIISIWGFAALTGVSITVIPLVFGRYVFARIIPPHVRKNDVYAFSIGVYLLGSALYAALNARRFVAYVKESLAIDAETPNNVMRRVTYTLSLTARITWTYAAFLFVLPTLFAFLIEFYFIVPLHTYFALEEQHVIHFVQSWTLGLLYVKLTTRLVLWHADSRPAQALRAVTRDGYLNPDAKLATRSFILPVGLVLSLALAWPWALARLATMTILLEKPESHMLAYRYAYPMCLALGCIIFALYLLVGILKEWRMLIRDEVYLIGERLHNFGDKKTAAVVNGPSLTRIET